MDADILVITLAIRIALPVPQQETPEAAAARPRTDVGQRPVIIPMRPVARLTVTKPDVLAGLIPVPMVAEVQENVVLLALILNRLHRRLPVAPAEAQAADRLVEAPTRGSSGQFLTRLVPLVGRNNLILTAVRKDNICIFSKLLFIARTKIPEK